jgi:aminoglycoside phosphotransferase (APT) family kinase protein/putative sterol carrier protein
MLTGDRDLDALRRSLTAWLEAKMPAAGAVSISGLRKPSAGLSNETFLCEAEWREGEGAQRQSWVLRLQPTEFQVFPEYDLSIQYRILQCLAASDVPVPPVRWYEGERGVLGSPFYVMQRVEGAIPSEVPPYHAFGLCLDTPPAERAAMWWSGIETLARIHAVDWRAAGLAFLGVPGPGSDPLDRQIAYYRRYLRWACGDRPQPVLGAALAWLEENRFEPARVTLCWGDSRLPNLMYRDGRVVAVLDWEMAFLGDPEADLGWWLFHDWASSSGYGFPRLDGFPGKEETLRRYEELSGAPVRHAFYHEVWAAFRFGVIMARIASRLKEIGAPIPTPDFDANNVATQALARLLDLPPPGADPHAAAARRAAAARVQVNLTGPGGRAWYVVCESGNATRHEGVTEAPDATLTASASDWKAIQSGELSRTEAFFSGRLEVDGDVSLLMQMEEALSRLSGEERDREPGP